MSPKAIPIQNHYTRLPGSSITGLGGVSRLYLGPDHLLCLRIQNTRAMVRRLYYADITAARCQRTWKHLVFTGILLALVIAPWIILLFPSIQMDAALFVAVPPSVLAALALTVNLAVGPTCATWIHTANHAERLPGLGRYRSAKKSLARLHEKVSEAQRDLGTPGSMDALPPFTPYTPPVAPAPAVQKGARSRLMAAAFSLSIFTALIEVPGFWYSADWLDSLDYAFGAALVVLIPAGLIRSYHTDCLRIARVMASVILVYMSVTLPAGLTILGYFIAIGADLERVEDFPDLGPGDGAIYYVMMGDHTLSILVYGLCGLIGLLALQRRGIPSRGTPGNASAVATQSL